MEFNKRLPKVALQGRWPSKRVTVMNLKFNDAASCHQRQGFFLEIGTGYFERKIILFPRKFNPVNMANNIKGINYLATTAHLR